MQVTNANKAYTFEQARGTFRFIQYAKETGIYKRTGANQSQSEQTVTSVAKVLEPTPPPPPAQPVQKTVQSRSMKGEVVRLDQSFLDSSQADWNAKKCDDLLTTLSAHPLQDAPRITTLNLNKLTFKPNYGAAAVARLCNTLNADTIKASSDCVLDRHHEIIWLDVTNVANKAGVQKFTSYLATQLNFSPHVVSSENRIFVACPYKTKKIVQFSSTNGRVCTLDQSFLSNDKTNWTPNKCGHLHSILSRRTAEDTPLYSIVSLNKLNFGEFGPNPAILRLINILNKDGSNATADTVLDNVHEIVYLDVTAHAKQVGLEKITKILRANTLVKSSADQVLIACPYKRSLPPETPEEKMQALSAAFAQAMHGF
jgi:hypothetical protein